MNLHRETVLLVKDHAVAHLSDNPADKQNTENISEIICGVVDALAILAAGFSIDAKAAIITSLIKQMDFESRRFAVHRAELDATEAINRAAG
jgi:hypothetical protein